MKKLIAILLSLVMLLSLAACGKGDTSKDDDNGKEKASQTGNKKEDSTKPGVDAAASPYVGEWKLCYLNYDENEDVTGCILDYTRKQRMILYSNGTGIDFNWYDDYCNGGVAMEWTIEYSEIWKKDVLVTYCALLADEDDPGDANGYRVTTQTYPEIDLVQTAILGERRGSTAPEIYEKPIDTVVISRDIDTYAKIGNEEFEDCPELGFEDAFESIRMYREEKKK